MNIKAKFLGTQVTNARNYSDEKELVDSFKVIAYSKGELIEVIDCRCWMGRSSGASKVYAALWVNAKGVHTSGKGSAGGGGYCKTSAAIGEAIESAGFKLDQRIDGTGQHVKALQAVAACLGFRKTIVVSA